MSAAIAAARAGANVIILEKNNKLGRKLYATGNGRCNLSNTYMNLEKAFFSGDAHYEDFLRDILGRMPSREIIEFMNSMGILTYEKNGYIYPVSNQASAVVWAMTDELKKYGVTIMLKADIQSVAKSDETSNLTIKLADDIITAKRLIIATGGKSYASLGGSDSGYNMIKGLGIKLSKLRPALCPFVVEEDFKDIAGVRANASARLFVDDEMKALETGELQITDYGLSGIMMFNLSSIGGAALSEGKRVTVSLDFLEHYDKDDLEGYIRKEETRTILGALNGFINDKLGGFLLKRIGIDTRTAVKELSDAQIKAVLCELKGFTVELKGLKGYEQAQVTAGGIALSAIEKNTMRIKDMEHVYAAGEALDIDGICGGYNLTFAILSGKRAGESAAFNL
ncbi:MAG: aminoacetone oxidase family FAD-binding enzyme [Clostridium sp.]|nr:aminoacetone oxidase family FAD-binding enzyme [Clostridium sp.]MCM1171167.1 aminoacetone oxidase family FAD-binding enzyme [Clostridium sp.]MCM1208507.1 aminoacetone oxidase family FAD-binding enzyme [Ruminococcus sp.]